MPKSIVIQTGDTFRLFDSSFQAHDTLPSATYRVLFSQMAGHSLEQTDPITPSTEKMYGNGQDRIDRILKGYAQMNRSYGVLMSGKGGMGKTMLMRSLVAQMQETYDLPVIVVSQNVPGLADYIDSLGPAIVVFDEFEKNFLVQGEAGDQQAQFLTLFDGLSSTKRMYVVTCNDLNKLNPYLVNRTGRFHKHLMFDYPSADDITEYLTDAGVPSDQIESIVRFAALSPINYDHLRTIAFEMTAVGGSFKDVISDLNIKRVDPPTYNVTVTTSTGLTLSEYYRSSYYSTHVSMSLEHSAFKDDVRLIFSFANATYANGSLVVPLDDIKTLRAYIPEDKERLGTITSITMTLEPPKNLSW